MSSPHPAEAACGRSQPPPSCDSVRRAQGARPGLVSWCPACCPSCFSCGRAARTRWGGQGITGSSFPLRCANQNKTKPTKNTVVLSPRRIKTLPPPNTAPTCSHPPSPSEGGGPGKAARGSGSVRGRGRGQAWKPRRTAAPAATGPPRLRAKCASCCVLASRGRGARGAEVGARACARGRAWEPPRASPFSAARGLT